MCPDWFRIRLTTSLKQLRLCDEARGFVGLTISQHKQHTTTCANLQHAFPPSALRPSVVRIMSAEGSQKYTGKLFIARMPPAGKRLGFPWFQIQSVESERKQETTWLKLSFNDIPWLKESPWLLLQKQPASAWINPRRGPRHDSEHSRRQLWREENRRTQRCDLRIRLSLQITCACHTQF